MVVTVGLQDISSMYITLETSYVFILYVYYLGIKLTGFSSVDPRKERDNGCHEYYKGSCELFSSCCFIKADEA